MSECVVLSLLCVLVSLLYVEYKMIGDILSGMLFYVLRKAVPTGIVSGAAAQLLASPNDLVKVQMQMEGKRQLEGLKPR